MLRIALYLVPLAAVAVPALAQQVCANRDTLVSSLAHDFAEKPEALGMGDDGNLVELLTTKDGATWTILVTTPDGVSCVVATGQVWERAPQQVAGSTI